MFDTHNIDTVFDFTGKKAVGESTHLPILYYKNNINGKLLLQYVFVNEIFANVCL